MNCILSHKLILYNTHISHSISVTENRPSNDYGSFLAWNCSFDACILFNLEEDDEYTLDNCSFTRSLVNSDVPGHDNMMETVDQNQRGKYFSSGNSWEALFDSEYILSDWDGYSNPIFAGRQPGPFGGVSPYRLSGLPNVPIIMRSTGDSTVIQGNNLVLDIEVQLPE